jgi:hypothetical protein
LQVPKENLKIIAIVIAIIVVISSVLAAVIYLSGEKNEEKKNEGNGETQIGTIVRSYTVTIDSDGNYTVYLPIPVNETGVSYIMENFTLIEGNCTYKIENTTYGLALNVTGKGHVEFEATAIFKQKHLENGTVVAISGINPETHPVTLSMSNITYKRDENFTHLYTNATGYNTTKIPFEIPPFWTRYSNDGYLMTDDLVVVHSFIYTRSEKPVNVTVDLYESIINGTDWILSGRFADNGWHYVKLDIEEGPTDI